jgi:hypothetical protein
MPRELGAHRTCPPSEHLPARAGRDSLPAIELLPPGALLGEKEFGEATPKRHACEPVVRRCRSIRPVRNWRSRALQPQVPRRGARNGSRVAQRVRRKRALQRREIALHERRSCRFEPRAQLRIRCGGAVVARQYGQPCLAAAQYLDEQVEKGLNAVVEMFDHESDRSSMRRLAVRQMREQPDRREAIQAVGVFLHVEAVTQPGQHRQTVAPVPGSARRSSGYAGGSGWRAAASRAECRQRRCARQLAGAVSAWPAAPEGACASRRASSIRPRISRPPCA